jgi:hypothetical protein
MYFSFSNSIVVSLKKLLSVEEEEIKVPVNFSDEETNLSCCVRKKSSCTSLSKFESFFSNETNSEF